MAEAGRGPEGSPACSSLRRAVRCRWWRASQAAGSVRLEVVARLQKPAWPEGAQWKWCFPVTLPSCRRLRSWTDEVFLSSALELCLAWLLDAVGFVPRSPGEGAALRLVACWSPPRADLDDHNCPYFPVISLGTECWETPAGCFGKKWFVKMWGFPFFKFLEYGESKEFSDPAFPDW